MHVIGVLIAAWNSIEADYQAFIQLIFPFHMKAGIETFELLGNDERIKLIRAELPEKLLEDEVSLLEYFFTSANICKENRNVIAHAHYGNQPSGEDILLSRSRGQLRVFTFSISAVREMADSTHATAKFGLDIWSAINLRLSNKALAQRGIAPTFFQPLPEKPPRPRKWDQIREAPKPPRPPPGSSLA